MALSLNNPQRLKQIKTINFRKNSALVKDEKIVDEMED